MDDTPVHKAVREAVTNMVIHSDYLMNGILKVEKQDNCLKLSNPGNLKLPVSVIYKGGNSKARNPRMQNVLRMIGYGDNIGSGFPTILDAWKKENWRKPDLREDVNLHQVDLDLWMVSLLPEECTAFMQSHFGSGYDTLSSHQQIILCTAYVEKQVSNSRLQPLLETHSVDVAKDLKTLIDKGFLLRNNNGRWTTYEINGSYVKETGEGPSEGPSWDQVGTKLGPSQKNIVVLPFGAYTGRDNDRVANGKPKQISKELYYAAPQQWIVRKDPSRQAEQPQTNVCYYGER